MTTETARGIKVTVHYVAARKPFEEEANPNETLAELKKNVLAFFGLHEGSTPDGGTVSYQLFDKNGELKDLSQTIGQVAERNHEKHLQLKLNQVLVQG
jgi:hypothetical protein